MELGVVQGLVPDTEMHLEKEVVLGQFHSSYNISHHLEGVISILVDPSLPQSHIDHGISVFGTH